MSNTNSVVPNALPIEAVEAELLAKLRHNQVVIVVGPTGCGKTTRLGPLLIKAGYAEIGVIANTEPRRVAAMTAANYVSEQQGCEVGQEVGYRIRHERCTDPQYTLLEYMTEGVLIRERQSDKLLSRYSVIIVDEAHERNLNQEVILASLKRLLKKRPELRVVIMSATVTEQKFSEYYDGAPIVKIQGRQYPVEVRYLNYQPHDVEEAIQAAIEVVPGFFAETTGDCQLFVHDYRSINYLTEELSRRMPKEVGVLSLYGDQDPTEQRRVIYGRNPGKRHVIITTNVAETSITLPGVRTVVDTGYIKIKDYTPGKAFSTLRAHRHSKDGLIQRTGRAGREAPGICLRLMTEEGYKRHPDHSKPEILRMGLDDVLLHLLAMRYSFAEIVDFGWMSAPDRRLWDDAKAHLELLGALDENGHLTDTGLFMADIPLPPAISKMILEARKGGCVKEILTIAASFSTRPYFLRPPGQEAEADEMHQRFLNGHSDFLTTIKVMRTWRKIAKEEREAFCSEHFLHPRALQEIESVCRQLTGILEEKHIPITTSHDTIEIGKAVAAGLIRNLLRKSSGSSRGEINPDGRVYHSDFIDGVFLFPGSALVAMENYPPLAVCAEIMETSYTYARQCQEVQSKWLLEWGLRERKVRGHRREKNYCRCGGAPQRPRHDQKGGRKDRRR